MHLVIIKLEFITAEGVCLIVYKCYGVIRPKKKLFVSGNPTDPICKADPKRFYRFWDWTIFYFIFFITKNIQRVSGGHSPGGAIVVPFIDLNVNRCSWWMYMWCFKVSFLHVLSNKVLIFYVVWSCRSSIWWVVVSNFAEGNMELETANPSCAPALCGPEDVDNVWTQAVLLKNLAFRTTWRQMCCSFQLGNVPSTICHQKDWCPLLLEC